MTPRVVFTPEARAELIAAQAWYNRQASGLGRRFLDEVEHQVARIAAGPLRFPEVMVGVRRARLRQFPYGLFFQTAPDELVVIACFHSSRDPTIWRDRSRS